MANFRRRLPRTRTPTTYSRNGRWLSSWPAWWDVINHRRPQRRVTDVLLRAALRDAVDVEDVAWPLGNHKPHRYYW